MTSPDPLPDPLSDPAEFAKAVGQYLADSAQLAADMAALEKKFIDLLQEESKHSKDYFEYLKDLNAHNQRKPALQAELDQITADVAGHNARYNPLADPITAAFYNAEKASLDARQAAYNVKATAYDAEKAALDARAADLNARNLDIQARNAELQQEAAALRQRNQDLDARKIDIDKGRSTTADVYESRIAEGHSYDKHVTQRREFPDVNSTEDLERVIRDTIENADGARGLESPELGRRGLYYKRGTNPTDPVTVVFIDKASADGGTVFRPDDGIAYIMDRILKEAF